MPNTKDFWESLGVSIEDIIDKKNDLSDAQMCQKLAHKLESLSVDFFPTIKFAFNLEGNSLVEILQGIYLTSKSDFIDLFALAIFAEKKFNPDIIYEVASKALHGELARRAADKTIDPMALLLPLFKTEQNNLRQIYYEYLIQRAPMKKYVNELTVQYSVQLNGLTHDKISGLIEEFEKKKSSKQQRPIKLWWFDKKEDNIRVVFRREKGARSQIKFVERNVFQKTGDEKIFIISEKGNVLEMYSVREPKRTKKIAEWIMTKLTGQDIRYSEIINNYALSKVEDFINRLNLNQIQDVELLAIKVRNAPLIKSPTIEIECSECVTPAIDALKNEHRLPILSRPSDIMQFKIRYDQRVYQIKTRIQGNQIELISDNRNLRDFEKEKLSKMLREQIK
jgi:hypothetical protein